MNEPSLWDTPPALALVIPWADVCPDNRKHAMGRNRRIVLSHEYSTAKLRAHYGAMAQARGARWLCTADRVAVQFILHEPDFRADRQRDVSNYAKMLCDALSTVVWDDDSQIDDARYTRGTTDPARPRVEVRVWRLAEEPYDFQEIAA